MSCTTILIFQCLQIARADIRSHKKSAVSLVIADGHLIFFRGLCGYVWVNILTLSSWGYKELRFNSQCWSYLEVLGKLLFPYIYCLCSPAAVRTWRNERYLLGFSEHKPNLIMPHGTLNQKVFSPIVPGVLCQETLIAVSDITWEEMYDSPLYTMITNRTNNVF